MSKILIIFGSESDNKVYDEIAEILKKNDVDYELEVASAHRTPEQIPKILEGGKYSVVIAGAGLAAALPGVVAAHTILPVIGVPVGANYQGLDALLSIMQMPPGVPVLSVGVDKASVAAQNAVNILQEHSIIRLVGDESDPIVQTAMKKAEKMLEKFDAGYIKELQPDVNSVNIIFTYFDEPLEPKEELAIYVPLLPEKDKDNALKAIDLFKHSLHGLWVGLGRGDNAALAAVQIMNRDGKYDKVLVEHKQEMKDKILKK